MHSAAILQVACGPSPQCLATSPSNNQPCSQQPHLGPHYLGYSPSLNGCPPPTLCRNLRLFHVGVFGCVVSDSYPQYTSLPPKCPSSPLLTSHLPVSTSSFSPIPGTTPTCPLLGKLVCDFRQKRAPSFLQQRQRQIPCELYLHRAGPF